MSDEINDDLAEFVCPVGEVSASLLARWKTTVLPRSKADQRTRGEHGDERERGRGDAQVVAHQERPDAGPVQPERVLLCDGAARDARVGDTEGCRYVS